MKWMNEWNKEVHDELVEECDGIIVEGLALKFYAGTEEIRSINL